MSLKCRVRMKKQRNSLTYADNCFQLPTYVAVIQSESESEIESESESNPSFLRVEFFVVEKSDNFRSFLRAGKRNCSV